ncbi:MAG: WxL domain-containing protein [Thermomicrobiales bacterium]|nr:WxL domain-containing protein [Thermomicrobiales bacterium]
MFERRKRHPLLGMVGAAALSLLLVTPAVAADDLSASATTTATVKPGFRTITDPTGTTNFDDVNVTGLAQNTAAELGGFSVSDLTGTGAGWQVTIEASQFKNVDTGNTLATGSLQLAKPTVKAKAGVASPAPSILPSGSSVIDDGPIQIASAAADTGMGTYDFDPAGLTLSLPGDVKADTYTSVISLTLAVGPTGAGQ